MTRMSADLNTSYSKVSKHDRCQVGNSPAGFLDIWGKKETNRAELEMAQKGETFPCLQSPPVRRLTNQILSCTLLQCTMLWDLH